MIFLILFLGLVIRLISLNQSFWLDEATSMLSTKMSLTHFFSNFIVGDFHPPLYYLSLRFWVNLLGSNEISARSLSIIFALLTIYVIFLIGKAVFNKKAGMIAALLLATSPLHIYYSQEARMYTMSTFLASLSVYFFTKIAKEKGRVGDFICFSISIAFLGITDYLPLLILPFFWIFAILTKQKYSWWKKFIFFHLPLILIWAIWFPYFSKQLSGGLKVASSSPLWVSILGGFSFKEILLIPTKFIIGRISSIYVLPALPIIGYLFYKSTKSFQKTKLFFLWLFIPLFVSILISIKIPVLNYFRFLFILPAFYLIISFGLMNIDKKLQKKLLIIIILVNIAASFIYLRNSKYQREDWKDLSTFLNNSSVVFPSKSQREALLYYNPNANIVEPQNLNTNYKELYLMRYVVDITDPKDLVRERIENLNYKKTGEYDFNGVIVWKYQK
ncbi:MAG: glycosyltransferase family 39 protein [Candidatus Woesebacteria bacterium]|nr:MAG: glycosyltransferase family 39 protein [Candidatus Woesebacteria bacterium]